MSDCITREECQSNTKEMMEKLNQIQKDVLLIPSEVLREADTIYLRKDEYSISQHALTESVKTLQEQISAGTKTTGDRMFSVILIAVQIISTITLAIITLASK